MFHYKYRFFYAIALSACIFIWGMLSVILPRVQALSGLKLATVDLENRLNKMKQVRHSDVNSILKRSESETEDDARADLLHLMHHHRVHLREMRFNHDVESPTLVSVHFSIQGKYRALASFLEAFLTLPYATSIADFSIKAGDYKDIIMELAVYMNKEENIESLQHDLPGEKVINVANPVCVQGTIPVRIKQPEFVSVKDMKWVGYVRQDQRVLAMLALPNNTVIGITLGEILGREQAKVTAITSQAVFLLFANGNTGLIEAA